MITRAELTDYLHNFLSVDRFNDYCPNGLQVEGRETITILVTGVTASLALIEEAIARKADALLVHHGYFWKNESLPITGSKKGRLQRLLTNDLNLLAYHLPLDSHATLGNNAQLARVLNITPTQALTIDRWENLLWLGDLDEPQTPDVFARYLELRLGQAPMHFPGNKNSIRRVAWCSGAAQSFLERAADLGVDAYISGEVSESTFHVATERGIHYYGAGHHATERYGIKALGQHLSETFGLVHHFVDIPNPV